MYKFLIFFSFLAACSSSKKKDIFTIAENLPQAIQFKEIEYTPVFLDSILSSYLGEVITYKKYLSSFGFTKTKDGIFYHKPIDDHVYLLDDSGNLKNVFLFDFGNKRVPDSYRTNIEDKLEAFTNYTTLTFFTLIYDNYIYGSLFDEGHYKQFVLDRNNHKIYKKTDESIDRYGHWFGTCGSYLVSVFPPVFEKNNYPSDFPDDLKKALAKEKTVLCFYSIKP